MDETTVTIVGGGAVGLSTVYHLIAEAAAKNPPIRLSIYILDSRPHIGRGLSYDDDVHSNLMNTRAGIVSPINGDSGSFYRWLSTNPDLWQNEFPNLEVTPDKFVPRALFGLYLEHLFADTARTALCHGSRITPVTAEAVDISPLSGGDWLVRTSSSLHIRSDYVIMCCGNVASTQFSSLAGRKGFFPNPYPIKRLSRMIEPQQTVAVIGSRLSAVDTVLGLHERGHRGHILCVSNTGRLPAVRGPQGPYHPTLLTAERVTAHIAARGGRISIGDILEMLLAEMRLAYGGRFDYQQYLNFSTDPIEFLDREIAEATAGPRIWQGVLYATNEIIDLVWPHVAPQDKQLFLSQYYSVWLANRVSIPVENAIRIRALLHSGQLSVHRGGIGIEDQSEEDGFGVRLGVGTASIQPCRADVLVCAIGSPRDVESWDSPLIRNILASGTVAADPFGGVRIDLATGQVRGEDGLTRRGLFAIGNLTAGAHLFTSVLEINARHARIRARYIADTIERSAQPIRHIAPTDLGMLASS